MGGWMDGWKVVWAERRGSDLADKFVVLTYGRVDAGSQRHGLVPPRDLSAPHTASSAHLAGALAGSPSMTSRPDDADCMRRQQIRPGVCLTLAISGCVLPAASGVFPAPAARTAIGSQETVTPSMPLEVRRQ
eukprot:2533668-Rhodomonas_salina.5